MLEDIEGCQWAGFELAGGCLPVVALSAGGRVFVGAPDQIRGAVAEVGVDLEVKGGWAGAGGTDCPQLGDGLSPVT